MKKMSGKIISLLMAMIICITSPVMIYAEENVAEKNEQIEIDQEDKKQNEQVNDLDNSSELEKENNDNQYENSNPTESNSDVTMSDDDNFQNETNEEKAEREISEENAIDIKYKVHMQSIGWLDDKINGETGGDDSSANHIEGICIQTSFDEQQKIEGSLVYQAHVSDIGWQEEVSDGKLAGTTGRNKAIEALKIRLTGQLEEQYDVYYRVCIDKKGWLGWTKNGDMAGSIGFAYGLKAVQIKLYNKGSVDVPTQDKKAALTEKNMGDVIYQAHVSDIGWKKQVVDGELAGTTGKNKAVEAFKIMLSDEMTNGSIVYRAHVAGIGWQKEVADGELAGTTGQAKAVEALAINLKGEISNEYDIYYRAHISDYGWLGWAKNGEVAGSEGYALKLEAFQIKLVKKDSTDKPLQSERSYLSKNCISKVEYQAHVSSIGWQDIKKTGDIAGTTGCGKNIEAIAMAVKQTNANDYAGGIEYRVYIEKTGWSNWVANGNIAGTTGQGKHIEAIQIRLSGDMGKYCDVYYRSHVANIGWLGWAKNGETAGSGGFSYGMEAIQIILVSKNTAAPGNVKDHYREKKYDEMELKANIYSSLTPYLILVNRSVHKVYVFQGRMGNWKKIREWYCGDGAASTPTVEGTFKVQNRGYYFDSGAARCYWWTQFYGNYLFHSVLYNKNGTLMDGRVGMALSHGCVRLEINNAKWIYDTIPSGSTVVVYH